MRILITGLGLVATNLINRFEGTGHEVYCITKSNGMDLKNRELTNHLITEIQPEVIYHTAANCAESRGQLVPVDITENNLNIFLNVLVAAINNKVKRFIYTSSVAVYGEVTVPYKEDGRTNPVDVYGVNKLACEQILKIMAKVYNFEYTIFRPHNIYGPYMNMNNPYKNVVGLFMRKLMENKPYKLIDEGKMKRQFSYVDDVVDVLVESLDKFSGQTINVGSDKEISIKELSDLLQEITGIKGQVEYEPARPQEISMFLADHSLQNSITKYKETPIKEGLEKTWEWVKKKELGEFEKQENEINI